MKTLGINLLVVALLIAILDVAVFAFLPLEYTFRFPEYRRTAKPSVAGREEYPVNYFERHSVRGFDIARSKKGHHWVDGITYPIWSNSLGCFDVEHTAYDRYVYFAGDSYLWGYAPFEQKFGTLIARNTGTQILKCGVSHTGQRHQYEKFVDIVDSIGRPPKTIFVFFSYNDVANDNVYPQTTVIDGWQVDTVSIDENDNYVRHDLQDLKRKVETRLREIEEQEKTRNGLADVVVAAVKSYSITANIVLLLEQYLVPPFDQTDAGKSAEPRLRSFYNIERERDGRYWYADYPKAEKNKAAFRAFRRYAKEIDASLVVVLLPSKKDYAKNPNWYGEVRNFLAAQSIRHIDLTAEFEARQLAVSDLYWKHDGHFSPDGNRVIADILIERFPEIFSN